MNHDRLYDEIGKDITIFIVILVVILFLFGALFLPAQEKPLPLPPDIIHVHHVGCHIDAHHSEPPIYTLNAKTGEEEEEVVWWVTPFAQYVDLPSGEKREDWVPKEPIGKFPGTLGDMRGASSACGDWMKKERAAQLKEIAAAGHSTKK